MKNKIRKILCLTKVLYKDSFQNTYIFNKKTNKINKKSPFVWLFIILIIAISYLSYVLIYNLKKVGQEVIFLNLFPTILMFFLIFQVSLASTNVYYFSKNLELVLPLPVKSEELLISKFNTIVLNLYFSEILFVFFPLLIYGILTSMNYVYYIFSFIFLIIFPIFPALLISIAMMAFMKLSKFIKNKDIFQIIITFIFIFIIFIFEILISNKIINNNLGENEQGQVELINSFYGKVYNLNKYFLVINPSIRMLQNSDTKSIFELVKICGIDSVILVLFILLGKNTYLKDILKNNNYYIRANNRIVNYEKKCKKTNKGKDYIKKEFKTLFKTPAYFLQCIFPIVILLFSIIGIINAALPNIRAFLNSEVIQNIYTFKIDIKVICIILSIIQILFTLSNISITSVSREGKDAPIIKILPLDFFKQFIYKNIPQVSIYMLIIFIVLIFVKILIPIIKFGDLLIIFIISLLMNILNSELMLLVDFVKPNLNWDSQYEVIKQNNNKLFQYVLSILVILFLNYISKILDKINLNISYIIIISFFGITTVVINILIKININKIFKKIC